MVPQPKRKHSKQRKGKRLKTRLVNFPNLVKCPNCGKMKLPHRVCQFCGK